MSDAVGRLVDILDRQGIGGADMRALNEELNGEVDADSGLRTGAEPLGSDAETTDDSVASSPGAFPNQPGVAESGGRTDTDADNTSLSDPTIATPDSTTSQTTGDTEAGTGSSGSSEGPESGGFGEPGTSPSTSPEDTGTPVEHSGGQRGSDTV